MTTSKKPTSREQPRRPDPSTNEYRDWYDAQQPLFERLVESAVVTLKGILVGQGIPYLAIYGRTKARRSFLEKISRKSYTDPKLELTDLAGIRVIVYRRSDVPRVGELLSASFGIDLERSADKSADLGIDRVGYRSVHFICRFGDKREELPEFERFAGLVFEVQVRTVLEHAWAEIEHANYKLGVKLPIDFQRRLGLAAGLLESADRELDALAQAIDDYGRSVQEQLDRGELSVELNGITLADYVRRRYPNIETRRATADLLEELRDFGIVDLEGLASLLQEKVSPEGAGATGALTMHGLVRRAMMFADLKRYFDVAWKDKWMGMQRDTFDALCQRYGENVVKDVLREHQIKITIRPSVLATSPGDTPVHEQPTLVTDLPVRASKGKPRT